jgi:hypothetical protein
VNPIHTLQSYAGDWRGESRLLLHRPVEATYLSVLTAKIEPAMQQQVLLMRYAWAVEGEPQDGLLVLNELEGVVAGYWFDSWHMANSSMAMRGAAEPGGSISVAGNYPVSDGPDWGWRIVLEPAGDARLILRMFNVTPDGDEELAVDTDLARL